MLVDEYALTLYKDIFDSAFPGTFLLHLFVGKTFGYTEAGLQLFNFLFCLVFCLVQFFILSSYSTFARVVSSIFFILVYLSYGHMMSLERDVTACLFIALAYLISLKTSVGYLSSFLIGVLMGLTFSIKPHLAIGYPVFIYIHHQYNLRGLFNRYLYFSFIGFVFVISLIVLWLQQSGAWESFKFLLFDYLPQYVQLLGPDHHYYESFVGRLIFKVKKFLYYVPYWRLSFFIACFGAFLGLTGPRGPKLKSFVKINIILVALYSITLIISGQFFSYHFLSVFLFSFLFIGFFFEYGESKYNLLKTSCLLIITIYSIAFFPREASVVLKGEKTYLGFNGRVDNLTSILKENIADGDDIYYFDWVEGGVAHALFNLKLPISHRFTTDQIFKHHLHLDQKKLLIDIFLKKLNNAPPKWLVKSLSHDYPKGKYTTSDLPKSYLSFIENNYEIKYVDDNYALYKKL